MAISRVYENVIIYLGHKKDELGLLLANLATMQQNLLNMTEDLKQKMALKKVQALENNRTKQDLDNAAAPVMLSSQQGGIIYAKMVSRIRITANTINNSASSIRPGMNDLSERTESQAASIQQTTASMNDITDTVTVNSKDAHSASSLAIKADKQAQQGG